MPSLTPGPACAQRRGNTRQTAEDKPYTIPVSVRRVILDVVVTDAHHHAVHGLTRDDFKVFEDDKPQPLRSFRAFEFDSSPSSAPVRLPPMPPGTYMNVATEPERGPLYVIVYDAVHMRQDDQPQARRQLAEFLAAKPKGTRFAVFLLAQDFRMLQGFTTDPGKLLAAFDAHRDVGHIPQVFLMGLNFGVTDLDLPFEAMGIVGRYLEGLPGRKNLIWLSSEFPMSAALILPSLQAATVGNTMAPLSGSPLQGQGFDGVVSTPLDNTRSKRIMKQAIDALNAAQVSVYPVNVGGVRPELNGIDVIADRIATVTGGRAYYNTNDFRHAMEEATENGASYYELSYSPGDSREDGKIRRIRVDLDRQGLTLEYRRYYFAEDPNTPVTKNAKKVAAELAGRPAAHQPGDSMFAYMQHGAPVAHDLIFEAQFHAGPAATATREQMSALEDHSAWFAEHEKDKTREPSRPLPLQTYTIGYLVRDPTAAHQNDSVLELAAAAYDSMGHLLNGVSQNAVRNQSAGQQQQFLRAEQAIDVPTAAAWLRVGVRDLNTDRIGTLEIPLPLSADDPSSSSSAAKAGTGDPSRSQ